MSKPKTVNVTDCYNVELEADKPGHFVLRFSSNKHTIRIALTRPFVTYIIDDLRKFARSERAAIEAIEKALRGE